MKLPTSVFFGVPPAASRNRIVEFLKTNKFETVVIPCAGRFAIVEAVIEAGIKPENIICGDISLYSSVIGYYLSGQDLGSLGITTEYEFVDQSAESIDMVSSIIYAMMLSKSRDTNYYHAELKHAVEIDRNTQISNIKERLESLYSKIAGIKYIIIDMMELLDRYKDDENAFIFVDPPSEGVKGYQKMFDFGGCISWDEPTIEQFGSDDDMVRLFATLANTKSTSMILKFHNKIGASPDWNICNISVDNKLDRRYIFINRGVVEASIDRPRIKNTNPLDMPIISTDDVISKNSIVTIIPVARDVAWYYRDLFSHRFGVGDADSNYLIAVDGKITSVRGYAPMDLVSGDLHELYGIVYNNTRYKHLGRLITRITTSVEYADKINTMIFPVCGITTTVYKNYKEERAVSPLGFEIYESIENKNKDGPAKYKIKLRAPITERTFSEHITDWLTEEENYGKQQKKRKRTRPSR